MDFSTEREIFQRGYQTLGGIDEAGRGPLAGPVVAACVVCPADFEYCPADWQGLKDSKQLTAKKREEYYDKIKSAFFQIGIGVCDHTTIDRVNILEASFLAMKKAVGALRPKPEIVLVDGRWQIPNMNLSQQAIINGDRLVFTIAVASVIAKVTRDRLMQELDEKYPHYGFKQHKGYGTKLHLERLRAHGPCLVHRQTFRPVRDILHNPRPPI